MPDASRMRVGIVISEWNINITEKLLEGACNTLEKHGVKAENIVVRRVPGSFELTYGARKLAENKDLDAVIALGCVIRGDTPHFDYVCSGVTQGITALNLTGNIPFIFGLLTTDTLQQAEDRSGGKYGNKGDEAAVTAIKMAAFA
jgi:6,7-dimethyl-8-ribityllumazine synthase